MYSKEDSNWSRTVLERDRYTCRLVLPGCLRQADQAHHIIGRVNRALRLDPKCGIGVCSNCHKWVEENPEKARELMPRIVGQEVIDYLDSKKWQLKRRQ